MIDRNKQRESKRSDLVGLIIKYDSSKDSYVLNGNIKNEYRGKFINNFLETQQREHEDARNYCAGAIYKIHLMYSVSSDEFRITDNIHQKDLRDDILFKVKEDLWDVNHNIMLKLYKGEE